MIMWVGGGGVVAWQTPSRLPFVLLHNLEPGHDVSPRSFLWRCLTFPLTLLKRPHQSSISCHTPKRRSERIHVKRKGYILPCTFAQLDSLLVTLCQETCYATPRSFFVTDLVNEKVSCDLLIHPPPPIPPTLVTWVGPPTSIMQLSVLTTGQIYLGNCQVS